MKIFVINPGSTSTKVGLFEEEELLFENTLRHSSEEISQFPNIISQKDFRKKIIMDFLKEKNIELQELSAIVGRGGLIKPVSSGTYVVNDVMIHDLTIGYQGQHASNLGGILAKEIADEINIPSFVVDPVVVDEFDDIARFSGIPEISRTSAFHALNHKAVANKYCDDMKINYNESKLIVVHLGGGISVGTHKEGKVVDVTNAIKGEGPFTPERSGEIPVLDIVDLCFSGKFSKEEIKKKVVGNGGFTAYLGTNNVKDIVDKALEGDENNKNAYNAFIYQLCKEIGKFSTVLKGDVDCIIITGGIAYNEHVINDIKDKVEFIAPVVSYPGEEELLALAQGALRVLKGQEQAKNYN